MQITQGLGEDQEKEEGAKEAPAQAEPKKRKDKAQPIAQLKAKKVAKPTQPKPAILVTRATTRASTQNSKEQTKEKRKATKKTGPV